MTGQLVHGERVVWCMLAGMTALASGTLAVAIARPVYWLLPGAGLLFFGTAYMYVVLAISIRNNSPKRKP